MFNRARPSDWPATMEAFQRGELAMLATASSHGPAITKARHTSAYESYPLVIVGREDEPAARRSNDFASRRIVVSSHVAGSIPLAFDSEFAADHIVVAPSLDDALQDG